MLPSRDLGNIPIFFLIKRCLIAVKVIYLLKNTFQKNADGQQGQGNFDFIVFLQPDMVIVY